MGNFFTDAVKKAKQQQGIATDTGGSTEGNFFTEAVKAYKEAGALTTLRPAVEVNQEASKQRNQAISAFFQNQMTNPLAGAKAMDDHLASLPSALGRFNNVQAVESLEAQQALVEHRTQMQNPEYGASIQKEIDKLNEQLELAQKNRNSRSVFVAAQNGSQTAKQEAEFWDVQITNISNRLQEKEKEYGEWQSYMDTVDMRRKLGGLSAEEKAEVDKLTDFVQNNFINAPAMLLDDRDGEVYIAAADGKMQPLRDMGYSDEEIIQLVEYNQRQRNAAKAEERQQWMENFMQGDSYVASAVSAALTGVPTQPQKGSRDLDATILSFVTSPLQGLGLLEYANAGYYVSPYMAGLDANSPYFTFNDYTQGLRKLVSEEIAENFKWEIGDTGVNVASFLYNTGMSLVDSVALIETLGPASIYIMGMGAASNTAQDITKRGGTAEQAIIGGLAAGVAEAFFEKISVDKYLSLKGITPKTFKQFSLGVGGQALAEGSEELNTEIANLLTDALVMGEKSNFNLRVEYYMSGLGGGLSREEAQKKAIKDDIISVAMAFAGGLLSGGAMGSMRTGPNYIDYKTEVTAIDKQLGALTYAKDGGAAIVTEGLRYAEGSEVYKLASKLDKAMANATEENAATAVKVADIGKLSRLITENALTTGPNAEITQKQQVQAENPEAHVVSATVEAFIAHHIEASQAATRADVLDSLMSGIAVTGDELISLKLRTPATRAVIKELTGIEYSKARKNEDLFKEVRELFANYVNQQKGDRPDVAATLRNAMEAAEASQKAVQTPTTTAPANPANAFLPKQATQQAAPVTSAAPTSSPADAFLPVAAKVTKRTAETAKQAPTRKPKKGTVKEAPKEDPRKDFPSVIVDDGTEGGTAMNYHAFATQLGARGMSEAEILNEYKKAKDQNTFGYKYKFPEVENAEPAEQQKAETAEKPKGEKGGRAAVSTEARQNTETTEENSKPNREQEWAIKLINHALKQSIGYTAVLDFDQNLYGQKGLAFVDRSTKTIHFNGYELTTAEAVLYTLGHELVHPVGTDSMGDTGTEFVNDVVKHLFNAEQENFQTVFDEMRETYIKHEMDTRGISREEASARVTAEYVREELAADAMRDILGNVYSLVKFTEQKPENLRYIDRVVNKFRALVTGQSHKGDDAFAAVRQLDSKTIARMKTDPAAENAVKDLANEIDYLLDRIRMAYGQLGIERTEPAEGNEKFALDTAGKSRYDVLSNNEEAQHGRTEERSSDYRGRQDAGRTGSWERDGYLDGKSDAIRGVSGRGHLGQYQPVDGRTEERSSDYRGRQDAGRTDFERTVLNSADRRNAEGRLYGRGNLGVHAGELIPEATRRIMDEQGIPNLGLVETEDRAAFSNALEAAKAANPNGGMVDSQSVESLTESNARMFMREDGLAGVAVEADGNIVGVFKHPALQIRKAIDDLICTAVAAGGNHLDCYATYEADDLRYKYSRLGFRPVAYLEFNREYAAEDWRYGEPDVVMWVHSGDSLEEMINRLDSLMAPTREAIHETAKFEDYDGAKAHQAAEVQKTKPDTKRFALSSSELDSKYMDAVKRNDTWTISNMILQAARDHGYNTPKLYHGTKGFGFTAFDPTLGGGAIFATTSPMSAKTYSGETDVTSLTQNDPTNEEQPGIYSLYGKTGSKVKTLEFDAKGRQWSDLEAPYELGLYGRQTTRDIAKAARDAGYKSVIIHNLRHSRGEIQYDAPTDVYVFFDPSQIKSADPVTYDNKGEIIPLSKRFNSWNNDIRWALSDSAVRTPALQTALDMLAEGKTPNDIFVETGLAVGANNSIRDGIGGPLQMSAEDVNMYLQKRRYGDGEGTLEQGEDSRVLEAHGTRRAGEHGRRTGSSGGTVYSRAPEWDFLGMAQRAACVDATERILIQSRGSSDELLAIFKDSFENAAQSIYSDYAVSKIVAENKWGKFLPEIDELLAEYDAILAEENSTDGSSFRWAVSSSQSFDEQVKAALKDSLPENRYAAVSYPTTPQLLLNAGLDNLPMALTAKHVKDINHPKDPAHNEWHGIDEKIIAKLPDLIKEPAMIVKSKQIPGDIMIITDQLDGDGYAIGITMHPNGEASIDGNRKAANFITTMSERKNVDGIMRNAARDGDVIFWDKNKCQNLAVCARTNWRRAGVQNSGTGFTLPSNLTTLPDGKILQQVKAPVKSKPTTATTQPSSMHSKSPNDYRWAVSDKKKGGKKPDPNINPDTGYAYGSMSDSFVRLMNVKGREEAISLLNSLLQDLSDYETKQTEKQKREAANAFLPRPALTDKKVEQNRKEILALIDKYGTRGSHGDSALPTQIDDKTHVRGATQTAYLSDITPDALRNELEDQILSGDAGATYVRVTDAAALKRYGEKYRDKSFNKRLSDWRARLHGGERLTKDDIILAEQLYVDACENRDLATAQQLIAEIAVAGTQMGQATQAIHLLNKLTPSGQLYYLQNTVDRLERTYKNAHLEINSELAKKLLNAGTREEINAAVDEIVKDLARQMPASAWEKWNAWRYLAMLGNPRTHIRNFFGNGIFAPAVIMKDVIDMGLEHMFIRDPNARTKGIANAEQKAFADEDYAEVKDLLGGGGKYSTQDMVMDARNIFKTKWLEAAREENMKLLEKEDAMFLHLHYRRALASFLAARNADLSTLKGENSTREGRALLNEARQYAILEAQKATYRDFSNLASALNHMKRNAGTAGAIFVDGVMPFTKTPVNVLRRGLEYSPLGLAKTLTYDAVRLAKGDITASDFLNNASSGLTGSAVVGLGVLLSNLGWLVGGLDGDSDEDEFEETQGMQGYALKIGDTTYTVDWMAPIALPLFVGAELAKLFNDDAKEDYRWVDAVSTFTTILEPMFNLSMMDGINSTLQSIMYSREEQPLWTLAQSVATSYLGQGIPTVLGQLARTIDDSRRSTFVPTGTNSIESALMRFWQTSVLGKTPVASEGRMLYLDQWGRADTDSSIALRFLENFLSPGYVGKYETSYMEEELKRLYNDTKLNVFPPDAEKSFAVNGETYAMTQDEYKTYATTLGQKSYDMLTTLTSLPEYNDLTDSEKAAMVADVYSYAKVVAKTDCNGDYATGSWQDRLYEMEKQGFDAADYFIVKATAEHMYEEATANTIAAVLAEGNYSAQQMANILSIASGPNRKYEVDGEEYILSEEDYEGRVAAYSRHVNELLSTSVNNATYTGMSIDAKTDYLSDVAGYATDVSRMSFIDGFTLPVTKGKLYNLEQHGYDITGYWKASAIQSDTGASFAASVVEAGLNPEQGATAFAAAESIIKDFTDPNRSGYEFILTDEQSAEISEALRAAILEEYPQWISSSRYSRLDTTEEKAEYISEELSDLRAEIKRWYRRQLVSQGVSSTKK